MESILNSSGRQERARETSQKPAEPPPVLEWQFFHTCMCLCMNRHIIRTHMMTNVCFWLTVWLARNAVIISSRTKLWTQNGHFMGVLSLHHSKTWNEQAHMDQVTVRYQGSLIWTQTWDWSYREARGCIERQAEKLNNRGRHAWDLTEGMKGGGYQELGAQQKKKKAAVPWIKAGIVYKWSQCPRNNTISQCFVENRVLL